jgi:hypothetical protein
MFVHMALFIWEIVLDMAVIFQLTEGEKVWRSCYCASSYGASNENMSVDRRFRAGRRCRWRS